MSGAVLEAALRQRLAQGGVTLEPFAAVHVEPLRAACAKDAAIWTIYPVNMIGPDFDHQIAGFAHTPGRVRYAVLVEERLVGVTSYLGIDEQHRTVEIGGSYLEPTQRGTGVNLIAKRLMLEHAFACGIRRVEFRVDTRNARSQAAVSKLGAVQEGVLRRDKVTWTGHVRDTAIYSILADEWPR